MMQKKIKSIFFCILIIQNNNKAVFKVHSKLLVFFQDL